MPLSPPPKPPLIRRPSFWLAAGTILIVLSMAVAALKEPGSGRKTPGADAQPDLPPDSAQRLISPTTLALRKKLELPFQLNFSRVSLPTLLKWIEAQLDIEFRLRVPAASLEDVTVQASDEPLAEVLCALLFERGMCLVLQEDAVVIVPCGQERTIREAGTAVFEMDAQLPAALDKPFEVLFGDHGQFRLHLFPQDEATGQRAASGQHTILASLYVNRELQDFAEVKAREGQWSDVPFGGADGLSLALKPVQGEESTLVLGVRFVYTERKSVESE